MEENFAECFICTPEVFFTGFYCTSVCADLVQLLLSYCTLFTHLADLDRELFLCHLVIGEFLESLINLVVGYLKEKDEEKELSERDLAITVGIDRL